MAPTCLKGNPFIPLPAGLHVTGGAKPSITFIGGKLYTEATIPAFGKLFQDLTDYEQEHQAMFGK